MSDDDGFVERPPRASGKSRVGSLTDRLKETVVNGQAILVVEGHARGNTALVMRLHGFRVRTTKRGAPEGMVYAWAEKIEQEEQP